MMRRRDVRLGAFEREIVSSNECQQSSAAMKKALIQNKSGFEGFWLNPIKTETVNGSGGPRRER